MIKLNVEPLSVNKVWRGRRFKTPAYEVYEKEVYSSLPSSLKIPEGKLFVYVVFGFSNSGSDVDNCAKPFLDILQKKYEFNDNRIYRLILDKTIVDKKKEFVSFSIQSMSNVPQFQAEPSLF